MNDTRDRLVAHARNTIARGSKSFAAASRLFGREARERVWLLYAWCRACDDLVDGQDLGGALSGVDDPQIRIARVEALTDAAIRGIDTGDPSFDCLRLVARECALPPHYIEDVVTGFALDADGWRPETADDLLAYCYHVAGAVGCLMAIVMGVRPDDHPVLDRACDLGLAFQLCNVARDVAEDAAGGRCYLPTAWLTEQSLHPGELLNRNARPRLALLTGRLAELAGRYEASARIGTPALPFRAAWAVLAAADIYGGIGRKVAAAGQAALDDRMTTSTPEKLGALGKAVWLAARRKRLYPGAQRDPMLWHRPRLPPLDH